MQMLQMDATTKYTKPKCKLSHRSKDLYMRRLALILFCSNEHLVSMKTDE